VALSLDSSNSRRGRRRRGGHGRRALSEINVTPLVDVMLVLLIIFMISAPLLTAGVPVELPKTEANAINDQTQPLTLTIRTDGTIFLGADEVPFGDLAPRMRDMAGGDTTKPVYVRADGRAPYAVVAQVMASLSTSGFSSIGLITDTGGPSSGLDHLPPVQGPAPSSP
jgi:biopolymer transport protein TolR